MAREMAGLTPHTFNCRQCGRGHIVDEREVEHVRIVPRAKNCICGAVFQLTMSEGVRFLNYSPDHPKTRFPKLPKPLPLPTPPPTKVIVLRPPPPLPKIISLPPLPKR